MIVGVSHATARLSLKAHISIPHRLFLFFILLCRRRILQIVLQDNISGDAYLRDVFELGPFENNCCTSIVRTCVLKLKFVYL